MKGLPYYKRYPRDFLEGTTGMPFDEKCAYAFLLDLIYMHAGRLPDDPRFIAGLLNCSVKKWNAIRESLIRRGKIASRNGCIENFRAIIEVESSAKLQDQSKIKARKRWDKEAENQRQLNLYNDLSDAAASVRHIPEHVPERYHTESDTYKEEEDARAREAISESQKVPVPVLSEGTFDALTDALGLEPAAMPRYWQGPAAVEHVARWKTVLGLSDADIIAEAKASRARNPVPPDGPKGLDR